MRSGWALLPWAIIILLTLVLFKACEREQRRQQHDQGLIEALCTTVETYRDSAGRQHARILAFEVESAQSLLRLQAQDSLIIRLQQTVRQYKGRLKSQGSVTAVQTNTNVDSHEQTTATRAGHDGRPVYEHHLELGGVPAWVVADIESGPDSTRLRLRVRNEYHVVLGAERQPGLRGLFQRPRAHAEVVNLNPYTETTGLRAMVVTAPRPQRLGIGPQVGFGVGHDLKMYLYVGVGLQYSLIAF